MSSKYSLVGFDLDGTLLDSNHQVSQRTIEAISRVNDTGAIVALCSGRSRATMKSTETKLGLDMYLSFLNGAGASTPARLGNQPIFEHYLPRKNLRILIDYVNRTERYLHVYDDEVVHVRPLKDEHHEIIQRYKERVGATFHYVDSYEEVADGDYLKAMVMGDDPERIWKDLRELFNDEEDITLIPGEYFVECLAPKINKGTGFRDLCKHLNVPLEQSVAFGDGLNDVEYVAAAGLGIAMKNAYPETKQVAKKISEYDNDHDGVAYELEKMLEANMFVPPPPSSSSKASN